MNNKNRTITFFHVLKDCITFCDKLIEQFNFFRASNKLRKCKDEVGKRGNKRNNYISR